MKNEPLVIKKRGEDGSRVITVRIKEDILASLDQLAAESVSGLKKPLRDTHSYYNAKDERNTPLVFCLFPLFK